MGLSQASELGEAPHGPPGHRHIYRLAPDRSQRPCQRGQRQADQSLGPHAAVEADLFSRNDPERRAGAVAARYCLLPLFLLLSLSQIWCGFISVSCFVCVCVARMALPHCLCRCADGQSHPPVGPQSSLSSTGLRCRPYWYIHLPPSSYPLSLSVVLIFCADVVASVVWAADSSDYLLSGTKDGVLKRQAIRNAVRHINHSTAVSLSW